MQNYTVFSVPPRMQKIFKRHDHQYDQCCGNQALNITSYRTGGALEAPPKKDARRRSQLSRESREPLLQINFNNLSMIQMGPSNITPEPGQKRVKSYQVNNSFSRPNSRNCSPVPHNVSFSGHKTQNSTPTPSSTKKLTNPKTWSAYGNRSRVKRYKFIPSQNSSFAKENIPFTAQKTISTNATQPNVTQPNETKATIQWTLGQVDTETNVTAPLRPPQKPVFFLKTGINYPVKRKKAMRRSLLLNTSYDFKNIRGSQDTNANINNGWMITGATVLYPREVKKKPRTQPTSSTSLENSVIVGQGKETKSQKSKPDILLGSKIELCYKARPLSSNSIRPKSSKQSFRQTNGFYNYDSESRKKSSNQSSKKVLDYSFESIQPPAEDELSFLKTFRDFHAEKLYDPKKAQHYLKESTAIRKEIYNLIDLETNVLRNKLSETPQRIKSTQSIPLEK